MKNTTLHIQIGERRTTVTLHPTLFQLASLKLAGQIEARKEVGHWLSKSLTDQLGEHHPKNQGVNNGLTKYATDAITSIIAEPDLYQKWMDAQLEGSQ